MRSWTACFDPELVPLRPFQHLYFFLVAHTEAQPWAARLPAFALHWGSCALVMVLVRQLGGTTAGAAIAGALFVLAPNVKSLAWVAAISAPGRVFLVLAGLASFVRAWSSRSTAFAALASACFALALCFHQSAVVFPGLAALAVLFLLPAREGSAVRVRGLLDARIVLPTALAAVYLVLLYLRPQRYNRITGLDFLPASGVKGVLALVPEGLRHPAIEGLRGAFGLPGQLCGAAAVGLVAVAAIGMLARGGSVGRFTVLAIGLDSVLPILAGYHQRYAYLASAFVAIGVGLGLARAQTARLRSVVVFTATLLGLLWGADLVRDTLEVRRAGAVVRRLISQATAERAQVGPEAPIAIVDLPDMAGRELDIPVFNWGFRQALLASGVGGPWVLLRTQPFRTTTDSRLVDQAELDRIAGELPTWAYDSVQRALAPRVGRVPSGRPESGP